MARQARADRPADAALDLDPPSRRKDYSTLDATSLRRVLAQRDEELEMRAALDALAAPTSDASSVAESSLNWTGKQRFLVEKVHPVRLQVAPDLSLNTAEFGDNLVINGDNLSVMHSLLLDYRGAVDVIYMDPPYNTGSDTFPYNDRFMLTNDEIASLKRTTLLKERTALVTLDDPNRHTKWVNHMAPRLWVAKKLLSQTGILIVSVDEHEMPRLWLLLDELYGPNNRLATLVWERSRKNDAKYFSEGHEYMFVWARSKTDLDAAAATNGKWRETKPGFEEFLSQFRKLLADNPDDLGAVESGLRSFVKKAKKGQPFWTLRQYVHVDERSRTLGPYKEDDTSWPSGGGPKFKVKHPVTHKPVKTPANGWRWSRPEDALAAIADDRVIWKKVDKGIPKVKGYLLEGRDEEVFTSVQYKEARGAVLMCKAIFGDNPELFGDEGAFPNPKDADLLARLFHLVTWGKQDALVLDPYAGSAPTAHAVLSLNAQDAGSRRFILIEAGLVGPKAKVSGADYANKITAERVRRIVSGNYAIGPRPPIPGGFTFMNADRKSITKKDLLSSDRERLSDIILQVAEEESNRVDCRAKGNKYLIGRTRSGLGLALVWDRGEDGRLLTSEKLQVINREAISAGLSRPYHIYASANAAPYTEALYQFCQIPDAILSRLGIEDTEDSHE
jgi:adenine-specific DNA-methyltransferase